MNFSQSRQDWRLRLALAVLIAAGLAVVLVLIWLTRTTLVQANSTDISNARTAFPSITGQKLDSCSLCHTASIPALNPFGADYKAYGRSVAAFSVQAFLDTDSDGDGISNINEINGMTFPGDPGDPPANTPTHTSTPFEPATSTATPSSTAVPSDTPTAENSPTTTMEVPTSEVPPSATPEATRIGKPTESEEEGEGEHEGETEESEEHEHQVTRTPGSGPTEEHEHRVTRTPGGEPSEEHEHRMTRTPRPAQACATPEPGSHSGDEDEHPCGHGGEEGEGSSGLFGAAWHNVVSFFQGSH